jgi:hypothetical protein
MRCRACLHSQAVIPPSKGLYAAESTVSFFKDSLPPIYSTEMHMCALRPGDVLLLPPRYTRGSFRATPSVDITLGLPGLAVPYFKKAEEDAKKA